MNEIPFQQMISEACKSDRKDYQQTSWHASSLGNCLRGQYYQRLGVEPDKEIDERTLRVFQCGNMFEDWVVDLVKGKFDSVETQVRVEDKNLDVSGYADIVIGHNGGKKVYEIKSKHSKAFWWMQKSGNPMRQHEYQVWLYLKLLGISEGAIVYLSKDDLAILEYPVSVNDKELEGEVMERINLLNKAWKEKNPLILPLPADKSWQANYCNYHSHCLGIKKLIK